MRAKAFFLGLLLTLVGLTAIFLAIAYATSPRYYNVLIVGSDQRGSERARSDVMFVVAVPKSGKKQPFFLTIPRDTLIEHDEYGLQKVTHFYALGERPPDGKLLGNIELTKNVIAGLLGVPIDATVEVTFASFEEIINTLGGAVLNGQVVNGPEALKIVRDRFTGSRSDFDRQADARQILRSLITKVKEPQQARAMLAYFQKNEKARLQYAPVKLWRFLLGAAISRRGHIAIGAMEEASVPGAGQRIYTPAFDKELYYWVIDQAELQKLIQAHF